MNDSTTVQNIAEGLQNFLKKEKKEHLLPQIISVLKSKASGEGQSLVVHSGKQLTSQQKVEISQILKQKFGEEVAEFSVDEKLLGGLKIIMGDRVLDLSYRAKLNSLGGEK